MERKRVLIGEREMAEFRKHRVKTWPEFFDATVKGMKDFEVRLNDRDYKVGDVLELAEWDPDHATFTGLTCFRRITYMTTFQQKVGYVVLGIARF